jgi:hypothetical protein
LSWTENKYKVVRVVVMAVFAIGIPVASAFFEFDGRLPNASVGALGTLLLTLLLVAAILERALDVWLSLTMGGEADRLDAEIRSLKSKIGSTAPDEQAVDETKRLSAERANHRGATRQKAAPVAVGAGMVISAIGLRSLQPLFEKADPAWLASVQGRIFVAVDVLVTGSLLAGGSDGIHWIVALYRDWTTKSRVTTG